ncbi:hypothetical protein FZEAL_9085 [Fusarium zealandicum]|uniref:Uncharacterized protein n=1 Tax=Fusarium zealandicum TaxID=1053134 RepID=A0A8H4UCM5_9HYPO|nr:hypothetical protein FZEAL_9085 [Fusarium zealandicum]
MRLWSIISRRERRQTRVLEQLEQGEGKALRNIEQSASNLAQSRRRNANNPPQNQNRAPTPPERATGGIFEPEEISIVPMDQVLMPTIREAQVLSNPSNLAPQAPPNPNPNQGNRIDINSWELPVSAVSPQLRFRNAGDNACAFCGVRYSQAPEPGNVGQGEYKAYLPCGHHYGHKCLFRYLKSLSLVHQTLRKCPTGNCISLRHLCEHVSLPSVQAPERPHAARSEPLIDWRCEYCESFKGKKHSASLDHWENKEYTNGQKKGKRAILNSGRYRVMSRTAVEKLDKLCDKYWAAKEKNFGELHRRQANNAAPAGDNIPSGENNVRSDSQEDKRRTQTSQTAINTALESQAEGSKAQGNQRRQSVFTLPELEHEETAVNTPGIPDPDVAASA